MRIILLCSIFPPEPFVAAQTAFSMAKKFSALSHQVTVITSFPSHPGGKIYPSYKNRLFLKEKSQYGFEVVRCFTAISSKSTFLSRFTENIVFGISAAVYMLFTSKADVIHSDTWPVFATGLMSVVARLRRIPYIIRVVDLYPESIVAQGRLGRNHWAIRLMRQIDGWIAEGAKHVIVLTNSFAQVYQHDRKIPQNQITIIPDWVEDDLDCVDVNEAKEIRRRFKISDNEFLVAYGGNISVAAGVDTLVKACTSADGARILIAGGGSELALCQELANGIAPEKIFFYSPWPKEKTMALYQSADVLVLPTHGAQSLASIPSKVIRYMLSGRPIIAAGLPGTELYNLIKESGCGWIIPPDDPDALALAISNAKRSGTAERDRRGRAGREYALQNLTADVCLPEVIRIVEGKSA